MISHETRQALDNDLARAVKQRKARQLLMKAVADGILTRPEFCSKCGRSDLRICGHHHDYSKPLDVEWLCSSCHSSGHGGLPNKLVFKRILERDIMKHFEIWWNRSEAGKLLVHAETEKQARQVARHVFNLQRFPGQVIEVPDAEAEAWDENEVIIA